MFVHSIRFNVSVGAFTHSFFYLYRAAVKTVIDRLTQGAFVSIYRALLDQDKLIYALTLALEVCIFLFPILNNLLLLHNKIK